jgi:hypothetical protein
LRSKKRLNIFGEFGYLFVVFEGSVDFNLNFLFCLIDVDIGVGVALVIEVVFEVGFDGVGVGCRDDRNVYPSCEFFGEFGIEEEEEERSYCESYGTTYSNVGFLDDVEAFHFGKITEDLKGFQKISDFFRRVILI